MTGRNIPFYCVFGKDTEYPNVQFNVPAVLTASTTEIECDIPTYGTLLTSLTPITFRVSYNLQEYYGDIKLWYYPPIQVIDFNDKLIT